MAKVVVEKSNGLFNLKPLYEWFQQACDGLYRLEVRRIRKPRSNDQNGWLWGCIYPMLLDGLVEQGWEFASVEQVHEFFKNLLARESVVNRDTGEVVEFPSSTARMDTAAFSAYCEKLRDYGREYLSIEIPDPDRSMRAYDKNS